MNVTDSYMLQQMQQMAAGMTGIPQTGTSGNKDKDGSSFQEMMDQTAGSASSAESKKDVPQQKPVKDGDQQDAENVQTQEKAPVQKEEETLRPQDMTANPNVVQYLDFFRPEIAGTAAGEALVEVPVEGIPQPAVEEAHMDLGGEMPALDTQVESQVQAEVSMGENQESFQQSMQELPQEQQAAPEQAPEAVQDDQPAQVQQTAEPAARETEDAPEVEVVKPREEAPEPEEAADVQQSVFHEAKAAPVKVGESYESVDTQAPDMEEQLARTIQQTVQTGGEKVEIRLTPENLGALTIEMTKDASGALQVVLHASNSRAAGLLSAHLDGLHTALQSYGPEPVHVEVQRNQDSQQQHFQHADPDGRGNQQHQQQEERRQEQTGGEDFEFLQKLRLGLFGAEEL